MAISNGVIFIWTGTNAGIPAGWERVTDLDVKYPKAVSNTSTEPNTTGGADTHTHTSPAHSHTELNHTHTISLALTGANYGRPGNNENMDDHTHASHQSGNVVGGGLSSVTSTYSSVSNNPPHYEVIYITPTTVAGGLPNLALALSEDTGFVNNTGKYNGYYICDGNNSTPNLANKYLKGAGTGANAGGTGGSTTNVHTLTHTHSVTAHSHSAVTSPSTTPSQTTDGWGGVPTGGYSPSFNTAHTHTTSLNSTTPVITGTVTLTCSETVEPAYKKLLAIQNRSGTVYTPTEIIGLWLGTIANIPSNFEIISTMNDKHLKIASNVGEIGNTGGSNTHTHTNTHNHTASHTHTGTSSQHPNYDDNNFSAFYTTGNSVLQTTTHPVTVASATSTYSTETTTADSSSNEPEYRTVAYIKYKGETGGAFLLNFL